MNSKPLRLVAALSILAASPAWADDPFVFSNGNVDGRMAVASRPDGPASTEIEAADDFVTSGLTTITGASFTGLLTASAALPSVSEIVVEIYRVFPFDSNTVRTPNVPTRTNSPSDVAFDSRDSAVAGDFSFSTTTLAATFTANNSVAAGGIHASPNQTTGGNGAVSGQEVRFDLTFANALVLPASHYFFIPQVRLSSGQFYWLSSTRPIVAPGTPFAPDLQAWVRDAALDPDWLRVGTDIVGGATPPTFNEAFSLVGTVAAPVPEPETSALMMLGLVALGLVTRRRRAPRADR